MGLIKEAQDFLKDPKTRIIGISVLVVACGLIVYLTVSGSHMKYEGLEVNIPPPVARQNDDTARIEAAVIGMGLPPLKINPYFSDTSNILPTINFTIYNTGLHKITEIKDSLTLILLSNKGAETRLIGNPITMPPTFNDSTVLLPNRMLNIYHRHINLKQADFIFLCYKINYINGNGIPDVFKQIYLAWGYRENQIGVPSLRDNNMALQKLRLFGIW